MASLLEAAAAVGLSGMVLLLVTTSLAGIARIQIQSSALADDMFAARQLEQLIDRAVLAAGAGPLHPPAVSAVSGEDVVFGGDVNGDGIVDATTSETTALETRRDGSDARVRVRLGRQTMTVVNADDSEASLLAMDAFASPAGAAAATCVKLSVASTGANTGDPPAERQLVLAVPARLWN